MYIITSGSGRGVGGKQHRKSVQEHFINSLPSHSAMLSWNCIMSLPNEQTNRLIVTSEMNPDIGPIIQLNTVLEKGPNPPNIEAIDTNKTAKGCTNEQNEEKVTENLDLDDPKKNTEIENVIENLLKAINEDPSSKQKR